MSRQHTPEACGVIFPLIQSGNQSGKKGYHSMFVLYDVAHGVYHAVLGAWGMGIR